jgi:hypothetical protein
MRKLLLPLIVMLPLIISCRKDDATSPEYGFGFEANGVSYGWNFLNRPSEDQHDVYFFKTVSLNTQQVKFQFIGLNQEKNIHLEIAMHTPVIEVAQYRSTLAHTDPALESICILNGVEYWAHTGDEVIVNVTSIQGNLASGYFRAVMHDRRTQQQKLDLVKGYFINVEIPQ